MSLLLVWTNFIAFPSTSIIDIEQVNVCSDSYATSFYTFMVSLETFTPYFCLNCCGQDHRCGRANCTTRLETTGSKIKICTFTFQHFKFYQKILLFFGWLYFFQDIDKKLAHQDTKYILKKNVLKKLLRIWKCLIGHTISVRKKLREASHF